MNIPISEARKRLPELVQKVRRAGGAKITITVNGVEAAELRPVDVRAEPFNAAERLLLVIDSMAKVDGDKVDISSNVKEHLYGQGD